MLCALIRLAWFNVDEQERQEREDGGRKIYLGMPVTCSALLIPLFVGAARLLEKPLEYVAPWILFITAVAFISPIQMKKPGTVGKILLLIFGIVALFIVIAGVRK